MTKRLREVAIASNMTARLLRSTEHVQTARVSDVSWTKRRFRRLRSRRCRGLAHRFAVVRRAAFVGRQLQQPRAPQETHVAAPLEVGRDDRRTDFVSGELTSKRPLPVAQFLHVVGMGLMGSGKSTLLRALAWILGGSWLNQDEFCHLGKHAKNSFLASIRMAAAEANQCSGCIVVDKINTMRCHRSEIAEALGPKSGPRALIRFLHPGDEPRMLGQRAVDLGLQRIGARGSNHRSLKADNPRLVDILNSTVKAFEAPCPMELRGFDVVLDVDMTLSKEEALSHVIEQLCLRNLIKRPQYTSQEAVAATDDCGAFIQRQSAQVFGMQERIPSGKSCRQQSGGHMAPASPRCNSRRMPLFWGIFLDVPSRKLLRQRCDCQAAVNGFCRVVDLHVTLLFAGGSHDDAEAAARAGLKPAEFARHRAACETWLGRPVDVSVDRLVTHSEGICASVVDFPDGQFPRSEWPHITLAHSLRVRPVYSNEMMRQVAKADAIGICPDGVNVEAIEPPLRLRGVVCAQWAVSHA